MNWTRLPALEGRPNPCLCCPPIAAQFAPEAPIVVGFGDAYVKRGSEVVYQEPADASQGGFWTGAEAEARAVLDPDHDWRIVLDGPLHGETYQRQDGAWVLVERNRGFA